MIDRMFSPSASGGRPADQAIQASRTASAALSHVRLGLVASLDEVGEAVTTALESSGGVDRSELSHLVGSDRAGRFLNWLRG